MMNGESIRNEILQLLKTQKIAFHHIIHRETIPQNIAQEIRIEIVSRQLSFPVDDNYLCRFSPLRDGWISYTHRCLAA
jgi:hypothetical protein